MVDKTRAYDRYEDVVTPNGTGYVIAQGPDGVLVNEGGTYGLYPAERLSRPGEARSPEPADVAGQERQARKLAAAMSPEGLELRGDNARLARLNLEEGHGQVLGPAGAVSGWIRRRGRTWYGQDARGGIRSSTSWTEDSKGGPLRAAELMASFVALGAVRGTMFGGEPFRHIRPDEVTAPIFYSGLTDAQTRELRTLAEQWKTVADPDLRTAANQWSQEVTTAQMRRLATAVDEVAAHTDTTTPQGRRRQAVLQRLAANVRQQAHAAEGAFSTLPPPSEPDPWAKAYRPQETQQAADPTNAPLNTPAHLEAAPPLVVLGLPGTVAADELSVDDVDDAPQREATAVQQAQPDSLVPSPALRSSGSSAPPRSSGATSPPTDQSTRQASTARSSATNPEAANEGTPPRPDTPSAPDLPALTAATSEAQQPKPPAESTVSAAAAVLADDWALGLGAPGDPYSEESAAAAWALRGALGDYTLIDLMAAVDDDDAFARWKSRHLRHYGEGTGHVNRALAPGESVSYKQSAKHLQARIADQTVTMTWDRIRAWLGDTTTPEALNLLQAAEEAGTRLRGGKHGDALLAATGELALARDLRSQVKRLTAQVLDHVVQFMATTPVPAGRRTKQSPRAAEAASLFEVTEAPVFDLPGTEKVRADLDRLIAYLPDPRSDRESQTVPLSELSAGMVLDRGDKPVVITEIIRHPGRCDIVGQFHGPIRPSRIKHSVELSEQDPDPLITLAPLLPSLHELTGRQPEPDGDNAPGPLVEGHPALSAPPAPHARSEAAQPSAPPMPRLPGLVWDEQRRRVHGQALAALTGERPPLSSRRQELDPDDPYAQFTDNLEHQLQQLADHANEQRAVESAAQEILDTVADLAARARAYTTERLHTAEHDPAQLLQITLEPSRTAPFVRIAINAIMRAIDTAEASVTGARAKARVRAALTATVCWSPRHEPQGDSPRDFEDALVEFETVRSNEEDTVAELLAGPAQWRHFADMATRVEAATATPDPNAPAPRFTDLDEVRAHLADLAVRPLPDIEVDPAGLNRHELRGRAKYAGQLATNPTLELTPSRRLAIHGSTNGGWHVVAPGSADAIVPWSVKTRRHALRYASLLERLTDAEGNAYPWDADDFPTTRMPYEPQGGHLLYDWVESNQTHLGLGFHHRLRILRQTSQAYGWMEHLSLYRFADFDYVHPTAPADLAPGDEVMFTFDQDDLEHEASLAGYFPPLQGGNLAIGTAVVGENGEVLPGFWWPHRHPEQAQRLTKDVGLREGVRRARPGEYTLHAGITAHLPELTAHEAVQAAPRPTLAAQPEAPRAETISAPALTPTPTENPTPEPREEAPAREDWSADAPSAIAAEPPGATWDDEAPSALVDLPASQDEPVLEPTEASPHPAVRLLPADIDPGTGPTPQAEVTETSTEPDFETHWRERRASDAAFGEVLGIDPGAGESYEGYAGRFEGDYDITLPSGRYCYRTPGIDRKKYSVRFIPDPTRDWESQQIKAVSGIHEIMPVVRRHAARNADQRDPRTVELTGHEQQALDAVAQGGIFRSLGQWYSVGRDGRGTSNTFDWTTHALWSLSALGLITVPTDQPELGHRQHARLTDLGEQRRSGLPGEPLTDTVQPDIQEQTALFAAPELMTTPGPDDHGTETVETVPSTSETELPRHSRERYQALADIARGTISAVDGVFMLTNPRHPTRQAPSQKNFRTVMEEGLAEDAGGQIQLSQSGIAWFAHHKLTLPSVPRDVEDVEKAPLPPIDYAPLGVLPAPDGQQDGPVPPAPAPLPDNWHRHAGERSEELIQDTLDVAADAAERAALSTARDVADLAAGADDALWTHQHPLAQYDENAAAALEDVMDPLTREYATRAVHHLRAALTEAGHTATAHYVQNVRSPHWRTIKGVQADDVHRDRVRGIVVTYLIKVRTHAADHGLDADTIIHVLEDAAGWAGDLRQLGQKAVEYPHLPAAESVAEAAQHVANSLRAYALGETDTVDIYAEQRAAWRPIGPRPGRAVPPAAEETQERAGGLLAGDEIPPGPDATPAEKVRFDRRFDLSFQVGQFVDHRGDDGEIVTARVVADGINPVLRDPAGQEFRALREYRQSNFLSVLADDGSELPDPAWTAALPDGHRAVAPDAVKPGDVIHDYRENGRLWTSRLVIEVKEYDGATSLTCVGLRKFSGVWVQYDHRTIAVLDETEQSRQLAEAVLPGREVRDFAKVFGISLAGVRLRPADPAAVPAPPQVKEVTQRDQRAAGPETPGTGDNAAADAKVPTGEVPEAEAGASARPSGRTGTQPVDRPDRVQDQAGIDKRRLEQPTGSRTAQGQPETPPSLASAAHVQVDDVPAPVTLTAASAEITPAEPDGTAHVGGPDTAALPSDATFAPVGQDEQPSTGPGASVTEAATDIPADRTEHVTPAPGNSPPPHPPAAVREEGTVATITPPSAAAAEEPIPSAPPASLEAQFDPETATAYPSAAAYAAGHEALLAELDLHEQWLADTPAAAEAATILANAGTLGLPGLTSLLALQNVLTPGTDEADQCARLVQRLAHHTLCAQLTMVKRVFGQAARSTNTERLRELHQIAFQGGFIAFREQTGDGEMELGQYIQHRAQQITQQPVGAEGPAEETPARAEETTTVAVDPDDDSQMPVFELPGEALMVAEEAAPRLLAQARTHLAGGSPGVELLAHVHGRPVYALVDQAGTSAASLVLGLAVVDEGGSARAVTIRGEDLAVASPETLLTAVTAWMNAIDAGGRPLLDYAPSAAAQTPVPTAPEAGQSTRAGAEEQAPTAPAAAPDAEAGLQAPTAPAAAPGAPAPTATAPARPTGEAFPPQNPQGSAAPLVPAAPGPIVAPNPAAQATPDVKAAPPGAERTSSPPESVAEGAGKVPPSSTGASPDRDAAVGSAGEQQRQDGVQQEEGISATPAERSAPTEADRVAQLTTLARSALTDLGVAPQASGVLTADRTVVLTLETSGNAERDREIADNLRTALTGAIRQLPDQGLAAYRVDVQHTPQVGQGSLQGAPAPQSAPVPRERLLAANNAAAKIFAERLRNDPNAALARTYLTEERQLPPEVQQEWGLGYAPSDRGANRWDLLVRALREEGFTDDELLRAGLAKQSRRGGLIDSFDDRIMVAIHDEHGDIVGFSGRRIDRPGETQEQTKKRQSQKYFNTSNDADLFTKGDLLFGLHHPAQAQALASSSGPRVSVEGYFDVIAVARAAATIPIEQRPVAGAPMGADITERQLTVLRGLDTDTPRPHIMFLDADDSGHKVLLNKSKLLLGAPGPVAVTSASGAKDAAKLWEEGIEADGDGAAPVLRALEQRQPLLGATVEAVLVSRANESERANHAFDGDTFVQRTRFIAAEAARYIHESVQLQAPGDTTALEQAALTWAKRLHQQWKIPGHMTATAVLLGPGNHSQDYENEVYEQALDLLAADPERYFANDSHVRSRQSADEDTPVRAPEPPDGTGPKAGDARPGQWPAGTRASDSVTSTNPNTEPVPAQGELALSMLLPGPVNGQPVEHTERTTAADALHFAVHGRLGGHATETQEPDRLPQPLKLGSVHGIDLSTSGDDQTSEDPTVVLWLGPSRNDSLRLSSSRFTQMTPPELLAAVEWRAAQAAGLLGTPLTPTWLNAVRSIIPSAFPARPTPPQLAGLLDTIAQRPDSSAERTRHRAEQALALYTAGHADLALNHLAAPDHIWVLRNDGSWIQEEAPGTSLTWEELNDGFSQESAAIAEVTQAAAALPPGDPAVGQAPLAADLTVAHHSAHEALAAMRPYSIGLPGTVYEKITDLVAQMDAVEPAVRRLRGPDGERLMNRAQASFVRILEGLATVASKIRLTGLSSRLERTVARLRGQDPAALPAPRAVRPDRRMQDLAHIERDLERRMAASTTTLNERGELQEQWIVNRARWRARYEQLHGQPASTGFLPDNGLVAGAPPIPNLIAAHDLLLDRLRTRVAEQFDTDPHTGEHANPYDPTGDLLNGVAWALQQRLIGSVPTGPDPEGPMPDAQVRQAALTVTAHRTASPLTLRRTMNVSAERADRLLHRLEQHQIVGPYRADSPRTLQAGPADIDAMLARPAASAAPQARPATPASSAEAEGQEATGMDSDELDARIQQLVRKLFADQQERSKTHGGTDSAQGTPPTPRARPAGHREAEANALAAGQPTSLAPSQS